jgi:hypothetical protein
MPEVSAPTSETARKIHAAILQRLASYGQIRVAEALGVHESTVSRMKGDDLERLARLLAALDLKVVPAEAKCYQPEFIEHLRYFARLGFDNRAAAPSLEWPDE